MNEPESIVLCEGFHDRAFWSEWLLRLGCTDPGVQAGKTERVAVMDAQGKPVTRRQFGFRSRNGAFIRVVPCGGKSGLLNELRGRIKGRTIDPLRYVVVCMDSDTDAPSSGGLSGGTQLSDLGNFLRGFEPSVKVEPPWLELDDGAAHVALIRWETHDPAGTGLPTKQTLERLVCAAILAAYPERGAPVANWLASRPGPPPLTQKEFAWSQMAGWYAEHGCEDFYRQVWRDPHIAHELESRLRAAGAWPIVEELAG